MTDPVLAWAIFAFVAIATISMVVQAVAVLKLSRSVSHMLAQAAPLIPRAEAALESARETIAESRTQIKEISTRATAILDSTKTQLHRIEEVVTDAAGRAKNQLQRTEMVVEDTVTRVHETVSAVHGTIMRPIREVNGLAAGMKAGVRHLIKGNRPNVAHATQDEELFI